MRATGWRPQTPLAEGLKVAYEDFCRGEAGRR
jgi:nucleoside-diphosphate-sugar epimerase